VSQTVGIDKARGGLSLASQREGALRSSKLFIALAETERYDCRRQHGPEPWKQGVLISVTQVTPSQ